MGPGTASSARSLKLGNNDVINSTAAGDDQFRRYLNLNGKNQNVASSR